ncbi:probable membrane-associated kinase regulator 2 [Cynara cardunculus var. scolymus]|uniref:Membrane-associated kinase regulator 2 n=1 Tax=Cynara cardunculus var. scolymus TaxID=59895 RepID=A0A118K492_CYNCS|nr:probable membrane-associated kinase regulator 2 [Cynara cardunculus var. scolymus]KVI07112.1 hypothetical protein Ccrd_014524 [Cynara cardunculus var. scolymus]
MDVFSLLKFWRNAAAGDPTVTGDFDSSIDDEESFFDLVFTNPADEDDNSCFGGFQVDAGHSNSSFRFSSPGDVYLNNKRKILPINSTNTKTPQSPLRTFMLGFQNNNKSKLEKKETSCEIEEVKIGSMLKRDNSLRQKLRTEKLLENDQMPSKRFSKDVVNKYLNLMKPSYVKVSKRNNEKSNLSEKSVTPSSSPASSVFSPRKEEKRGGGRGAVFREVRKHLGKSRSASAILQTPVTKSDDSALEQQDGIQNAILHCKRSYNSPSQECCVLSRSGSAPSNNQPRISIEEENRSSI